MAESFANIIAKYVDAPYKFGGQSVDDGFDCFSCMLAIGKELGAEIPLQVKGVTQEDYMEQISDDNVVELLYEFMQAAGINIDPGHTVAGDLILFETLEGYALGLNVGNGSMLSAFTDNGVCIVPLREYKIRKVSRWVYPGNEAARNTQQRNL